MSGRSNDELVQSLRAAAAHRISQRVREQHLTAIRAAASLVPAGPDAPAPVRRGTRSRRSLAAVAVAAAIAAPTGVAVAAQDADPREALYGVKRATERVAGIVMDDLSARRRVAELRHLLDAGASPEAVQDAVDAAIAAVATLPPDHPLMDQLAGLRAQAQQHAVPAASAQPPHDGDEDMPGRADVDGAHDAREPDREPDGGAEDEAAETDRQNDIDDPDDETDHEDQPDPEEDRDEHDGEEPSDDLDEPEDTERDGEERGD